MKNDGRGDETSGEGRAAPAQGMDLRGMTPLEYVQSDEYLIRGVNGPLQERIDQIEELSAGGMRHLVMTHYEIGLVVLDVYRDQRDQGGGARYGERAMARLCAALPWGKTSLYESLWLAKTYTREQVEQLLTRRLRSGQPLTWSHIRCLAQVTDPARREDLLRRTAEESWTVDRLGRQVAPAAGSRAAKEEVPGGAAPPKVAGLIRRQGKAAAAFLRNGETVLGRLPDGPGDLARGLLEGRRGYTAAELMAEAVRLRRLARAADGLAAKLEEACRHATGAAADPARAGAAEAAGEASEGERRAESAPAERRPPVADRPPDAASQPFPADRRGPTPRAAYEAVVTGTRVESSVDSRPPGGRGGGLMPPRPEAVPPCDAGPAYVAPEQRLSP